MGQEGLADAIKIEDNDIKKWLIEFGKTNIFSDPGFVQKIYDNSNDDATQKLILKKINIEKIEKEKLLEIEKATIEIHDAFLNSCKDITGVFENASVKKLVESTFWTNYVSKNINHLFLSERLFEENSEGDSLIFKREIFSGLTQQNINAMLDNKNNMKLYKLLDENSDHFFEKIKSLIGMREIMADRIKNNDLQQIWIEKSEFLNKDTISGLMKGLKIHSRILEHISTENLKTSSKNYYVFDSMYYDDIKTIDYSINKIELLENFIWKQDGKETDNGKIIYEYIYNQNNQKINFAIPELLPQVQKNLLSWTLNAVEKIDLSFSFVAISKTINDHKEILVNKIRELSNYVLEIEKNDLKNKSIDNLQTLLQERQSLIQEINSKLSNWGLEKIDKYTQYDNAIYNLSITTKKKQSTIIAKITELEKKRDELRAKYGMEHSFTLHSDFKNFEESESIISKLSELSRVMVNKEKEWKDECNQLQTDIKKMQFTLKNIDTTLTGTFEIPKLKLTKKQLSDQIESEKEFIIRTLENVKYQVNEHYNLKKKAYSEDRKKQQLAIRQINEGLAKK